MDNTQILVDNVKEEIKKLLEQERKYLKTSHLRKSSDIDYGMGKIRAYERVLEMIK